MEETVVLQDLGIFIYQLEYFLFLFTLFVPSARHRARPRPSLYMLGGYLCPSLHASRSQNTLVSDPTSDAYVAPVVSDAYTRRNAPRISFPLTPC